VLEIFCCAHLCVIVLHVLCVVCVVCVVCVLCVLCVCVCPMCGVFMSHDVYSKKKRGPSTNATAIHIPVAPLM